MIKYISQYKIVKYVSQYKMINYISHYKMINYISQYKMINYVSQYKMIKYISQYKKRQTVRVRFSNINCIKDYVYNAASVGFVIQTTLRTW